MFCELKAWIQVRDWLLTGGSIGNKNVKRSQLHLRTPLENIHFSVFFKESLFRTMDNTLFYLLRLMFIMRYYQYCCNLSVI